MENILDDLSDEFLEESAKKFLKETGKILETLFEKASKIFLNGPFKEFVKDFFWKIPREISENLR